MGEQGGVARGRVLVVEDDAHVQEVLREFLCGENECVVVGSAEEALAVCEGAEFDLVLSDIMLPGASGLEVLRGVRGRSPDTVVVMVSGETSLERAIEAMRRGAFDYVTKPFSLEQCGLAVRRAFEHRELLVMRRRREEELERQVGERTAALDDALRGLGGAYRATLTALTSALEARDQETHGHSGRVVRFAVRLGVEIGVAGEELQSLEFGSLLHDIGKIGVPDSILRKPAKLDDHEWERMREHPLFGEKILGGIEFLAGAARVVGQHHERFDGTGYPRGLVGETIDLNARIFAVADAFDAMTSDRVYRKGRGYEEALEELERCAGGQFDPRVVEAFARVPVEEWEALRSGEEVGEAACVS